MTTKKTVKNTTKQDSKHDLDRYERIVNRAHEEIQKVHEHYKWLLGSITIIIVVACAAGAFLVTNSLTDMREDIRSQVDIVARDVQSRIDQEFNKDNIATLIETAAKAKVEEIAVPRIRQDVNDIIIPKIEAAERKLEGINDVLVGLENRAAETDEEQKLLSKDVTILRLFFAVRRGQKEAFEKLQNIASASTGDQTELAQNLLEDVTLYYVEFKFQSYYRGLVSPTGAPYNPHAEAIYLAMFDPNIPSGARTPYVNELAQRKLHYFVEELVRLVRTNDDLKVAARAAKAIEKLTGRIFSCCPPFEDTLDWWDETGKSIHKYKSPFPEIQRLTNLVKSGKSDEALEGLLKIVETAKGLADVRFAIANIYLNQGLREKALEQFQMIDTECEAHNNSLFVYAALLAEENRESEAIKILQKIKKFTPDKKTFVAQLSKAKEFETLSTEDEFKRLIADE